MRCIPTSQGPVFLVDYDAGAGAFSVSRDGGASWDSAVLAVADVIGYDGVQMDDRTLLLFVKVGEEITGYVSTDGGRTWATT